LKRFFTTERKLSRKGAKKQSCKGQTLRLNIFASLREIFLQQIGHKKVRNNFADSSAT
jgi:hypothetical protein